MSNERFVQYYQRVLALDPIAYWMQDERQGGVSYDISRNGRNGAYTGVTLAQPGIGDERTSPFFDGANDFNNVFSASLDAAFNGQQCTVALWVRVSGAGVWTDGVNRIIATFFVDANNFILLFKQAGVNRFSWRYVAGGVTRDVTRFNFTPVDWFHIAITADRANDEFIAYLNGAQEGAILNGLGVWAGALDNTRTLIGANTAAPAGVWDGRGAHAVVWDRVLIPAQIAGLVVVQ